MDWHGFVRKTINTSVKKICLILLFLLCNFQPVSANIGIGGYSFSDQGYIFTKTSLPVSTSYSLDDTNDINLDNLKRGEAATRNFFNLVEIGNASINKAAKKAGIKTIKYVDSKTYKIYIPFFFIPIAVRETKTVVYGD